MQNKKMNLSKINAPLIIFSAEKESINQSRDFDDFFAH